MELLKHLDPFLNNKKIINYHQSTKNIIDAILKQHQLSLKDYDNIYLYFYDSSFIKVAEKVFNYIKKNIKYVVEPENLQTIKTPAAILATGKTTGSDCKNYSLFFAGILDAYRRNTGNNFNLAYRFSSYDNSNIPEHVFVVINPETNKEIICDAVLNYFNEYKEPTFYRDKKINNMALMSLAGLGGVSPDPTPPKKGFTGLTPAQQQQVATTWAAYNNPNGNQISNTLNSFSTGNKDVDTAKNILATAASWFNWSIGGHSDYYTFDMALEGKKSIDTVASVASTWKDRGFGTGSIWTNSGSAGVTLKESPSYKGLTRIQALAKFYKDNDARNVTMAVIINDAILAGVLPSSNFINSLGEMAPEPVSGIIDNITGGGGSKMLLIGGGLLAAYLLFKKK